MADRSPLRLQQSAAHHATQAVSGGVNPRSTWSTLSSVAVHGLRARRRYRPGGRGHDGAAPDHPNAHRHPHLPRGGGQLRRGRGGHAATLNGAGRHVAGEGDELTVNGANVTCGVETANATVTCRSGAVPEGDRVCGSGRGHLAPGTRHRARWMRAWCYFRAVCVPGMDEGHASLSGQNQSLRMSRVVRSPAASRSNLASTIGSSRRMK